MNAMLPIYKTTSMQKKIPIYYIVRAIGQLVVVHHKDPNRDV